MNKLGNQWPTINGSPTDGQPIDIPATDANTVRKSLRVAFGDCPFWEKLIRTSLNERYEPSFVDLSQARLQDYDAVIPIQLSHYAQLMHHPRLHGSKFLLPSPKVVALCDDKFRFFEFLNANGFADFAPKLRPAGPPYPYVWKKSCGWWGLHCLVVKGRQDESNLDLNDPDWFSQEFVPGEVEFATHILRVKGEIRYVSTYIHKMASGTLVNGVEHPPLQSRFMRGCLYLDLFSEILALLEFEGTACFDYKVVDGKPVVFEANPRFGGSLCSDMTAYLDAYVASLAPLSTASRFLYPLSRLSRRLLGGSQ